MADFRIISKLVPLPVVNLDDIAVPQDGLLIRTPTDCATNFQSGTACRQHYELLAKAGIDGVVVPCPFGFASTLVQSEGLRLALTGVIPFPRIGGEKERRVAKRHPESKVATVNIARAVQAVQQAVRHFDGLEEASFRRQSVALHEIRKLNRTVKQTAERLCSNERPDQPDAADPNLVQIWKSAELMSAQLEVIELLANEGLANLPLNTTSAIYRICDKCARIYNQAGDGRISLHAPFGYNGVVRACDKTLPIIPSALFDNALKYSLPGSRITATFSTEDGYCIVRVTNEAKANPDLSMRAFEKGVRFSSDHDGTGNGLHLVKRVAEQHQGAVAIGTKRIRIGVDEVVITVALPELIDRSNVPTKART